MTDHQYFFSYAREDSDFALRLAQELRQAGVAIWLDQLDILGGQRWDRAVERALKACPSLLAVLSPDSLASDNVMDEISFALEEGKTVIPILARACDIPFRLRRVQHVDFTGSYDAGLTGLLRSLNVDPPTVREDKNEAYATTGGLRDRRTQSTASAASPCQRMSVSQEGEGRAEALDSHNKKQVNRSYARRDESYFRTKADKRFLDAEFKRLGLKRY